MLAPVNHESIISTHTLICICCKFTWCCVGEYNVRRILLIELSISNLLNTKTHLILSLARNCHTAIPTQGKPSRNGWDGLTGISWFSLRCSHRGTQARGCQLTFSHHLPQTTPPLPLPSPQVTALLPLPTLSLLTLTPSMSE